MKITAILACLFFIIAGAVPALGQNAESAPAISAPGQPAPLDTFLLIVPQSGPLARLGQAAAEGGELALKTWGGGFRLAVRDENDRENSGPPLTGVALVIGYFMEGRLAQDAPRYLYAKKPVILPFITTNEAAALGPETFFPLAPSVQAQGGRLALELLKMKKRPKDILVLTGGSAPSRDLATAFTGALATAYAGAVPAQPPSGANKKNQPKPPAVKPLDPKTPVTVVSLSSGRDFAAAPELAGLDKNPPDYILLAVEPGLALDLAPWLARSKASKSPLFGGLALARRDVGAAYLTLELNLNLCLPLNPADDKNKNLAEFNGRYLTAYNQKPTWPAALAYDAVHLAVNAASAAEGQPLAADGPLKYLAAPDRKFTGLATYGLAPGVRSTAPMDLVPVNKNTLPFLP